MSRGDLVAMRPDLPDIVDAVLWPVGGVLVHDAIVAPRTIGLTVAGTRLVPRPHGLRW